MTRRDLAWRVGGAALLLIGCGVTNVAPPAVSSDPGVAALVSIAGFILAIVGVVLVVQGRRVRLAFRIERSRHRDLPLAIRAHRRARR